MIPEGAACWNCTFGLVSEPADEHPLEVLVRGELDALVLHCDHPDAADFRARVTPDHHFESFDDDRTDDGTDAGTDDAA